MPFAIGIEHTKTTHNVGTLLRSAVNFGASAVFTIGRRYKREASDTVNAAAQIPLIHCLGLDDFRDHMPKDWIPIIVELGDNARPIENFIHPKRCIYILGPEDGSVSRQLQDRYRTKIVIPSARCLNVAVAGSIVMYDRIAKERRASLAQLGERRPEESEASVRSRREALAR